MIRPSSLSCLHAQNTRDEGGHMTSSSPAREERENIYISFFFFLFSGSSFSDSECMVEQTDFIFY